MPEVPPMSGVRVLEVAQGVSGPYCGWLLACAGAEVTKIEPAEVGDYLRGVEPAGPDGDSAAFGAINSGKRSVTLAAGPAGVEESLRLLGGADVVICDGGAGEDPPWNDRWIVDHASERTVVCRTTPLGSDKPATELEVQAISGLNRYLGTVGEPPVRLGADMGLLLAGAFLFQAALAALLERDRSGRGQMVETSALASLASVASVMIAAVDDPDAWEGFHCLAAFYTPDYGVKTTTGAISFSAPRRNDEDWLRLCAELGAEKLAEKPEYAHDSGRTPRGKELSRELSEFTEGLSRDVVLESALRNNALAVPVQTYGEVFSHPQVAAIGAVYAGQDGDRLGPPWRINGVRPNPTAGVPAPGQDNGLAEEPGQA